MKTSCMECRISLEVDSASREQPLDESNGFPDKVALVSPVIHASLHGVPASKTEHLISLSTGVCIPKAPLVLCLDVIHSWLYVTNGTRPCLCATTAFA
jgi:hypothetical protein